MSTASTKSRARKKAYKESDATMAAASATTAYVGSTAVAAVTKPAGETSEAPEISAQTWRLASIVILFVAAVLRLYWLELKPPHHDEGVNAFFVVRLLREGAYRYDPTNYHGPTIYYLTLVPTYLLGLSTLALRLVPACFGLGTVWLLLCFRKYTGAVGALTAAALIAVSPGAVYLSRYFIHEALFVFFTVGLVVAALRYRDARRLPDLLLASAAAGLLFATKETAFISAIVLMLSAVIAWSEVMLSCAFAAQNEAHHTGKSESSAKAAAAFSRFAVPAANDAANDFETHTTPLAVHLLAAIMLFVSINVLFYTSFFTNAEGISSALETFKVWTRTGTNDHVKPLQTYLLWLLQEEAPLVVLGAVGVGVATYRRAQNRVAFFVALWAGGMLAAYSLVPYKTPWLALNFIIPLAITSGYAVQAIYERSGRLRAPVIFTLVGAALLTSTYQTVVLNFFSYDDDRYPYVYAHTQRGFTDLVSEVERLAKRAGTGAGTGVTITSPDYWPLPWALRDYKGVGYHGHIVSLTNPIVICSEAQEPELREQLEGNYHRINSYTLRPGVNLVLYARRNLTN